MNSIKKYSGPINSSKNKLNSKINWLFNLESNAPYICFLWYSNIVVCALV